MQQFWSQQVGRETEARCLHHLVGEDRWTCSLKRPKRCVLARGEAAEGLLRQHGLGVKSQLPLQISEERLDLLTTGTLLAAVLEVERGVP